MRLSKPKQIELLYIGALCIYIFRSMVVGSSMFQVSDIIGYGLYGIVAGLLGIKLFVNLQHMNTKATGIVFFLLTLCVILAIQTKNITFPFVIFLLIMAYDVSYYRIAQYAQITILFTCLVIFASSQFGLIEDRLFVNDSKTMHGFGFIYKGMINSLLLHCLILRIYIKKNTMKNIEILIYVVISYILYLYSEARGTMASTFAFVIGYYMFIKNKNSKPLKNNKITRFLGAIYIPLICFFSYYLELNFNARNPIMWTMNTIMSDRLRIAARVLQMYPLKPFGREINWVGTAAVTFGNVSRLDYNYVDNGYIQTGIEYGFVFLITVCIMYSIALVRAIKNDDKNTTLWIVILGFQCMVYPSLIAVSSNLICVFCFSSVIREYFERNKKKLVKVMHLGTPKINKTIIRKRNKGRC